MGWDNSTKIMTAPIGNGDISFATGVAGPPYTMGNMVANSSFINKWAKYKPVKKQGLDFASQRNSDFTWKSTADWWKGYNGQCGLTFDIFNSLGTNTMSTSGTFFHDLLAGSLTWGYEKPTGGSYPYRHFDFLQYYGAAPKPVTGVYDNLRLYGGGKLSIQLDATRAEDGLGIQLSDLVINNVATSAWYVGILIWKSNSQYTFAFSTDTLGDGADSVEFTNMTSYAGGVTIVPFISSVRANQGVDPGAGTFLSCDVAPATVTIASEQVSVQTTINAQWMESLHGRVSYAVNIINNTTSAVAVNNLVITLYDGSQNINTRSIGNISVPAQDHIEYTGKFAVQNYDSTKTYSLVVSSSRPEVNGSAVVEEPRN
jgi:hypothetical protein